MDETLAYLTKYPPLTILVAILVVNSPTIFRLAGRWAEHAFPRWAETRKRRQILRETAQQKANSEKRDIVTLLKELLRENRGQLEEAREDFNQLAKDVALERQGYVHQMATLFEENVRRDARFTDAMLSMTESIQAMTRKMDKLCTLWEVYQKRLNGNES